MEYVNFLVHRGYGHYLRYCAQSIVNNSPAPLVLLGDSRSARTQKYVNLRHASLDDYAEDIPEFMKYADSCFINQGNRAYENFCYARWMYIRNYMRREKIKNMVYFDSDIMLTAPLQMILDTIPDTINGYANLSTNPMIVSPNLTVMPLHVLEDFVEFMWEVFRKGRQHARAWAKYNSKTIMEKHGLDIPDDHLSDMSMFGDFCANHKDVWFEPFNDSTFAQGHVNHDVYSTAAANGLYVDNNVTAVAHSQLYRPHPGSKEVRLSIEGSPHLRGHTREEEFLRVALLHFQGHSKADMPVVVEYLNSAMSGNPESWETLDDLRYF